MPPPPPTDALKFAEELVVVLKNKGVLSSAATADMVKLPLEPLDFKFHIISKFETAYRRDVCNTELRKLGTVGDVIKFFESVPVDHSILFPTLAAVSKDDWPKNLTVELVKVHHPPTFGDPSSTLPPNFPPNFCIEFIFT